MIAAAWTAVVAAMVVTALDQIGRRAVRRRLDRSEPAGGSAAWGGRVAVGRRVSQARELWATRLGRSAADGDLATLASATAREVRAGRHLMEALAAAGQLVSRSTGRDVEAVMASIRGGAHADDALRQWALRRRSAAVDHLVGVVVIGLDLGAEVAPALEAAAASLRDRVEVGEEIQSLTAQSRASAVLLSALPPVAAVALAVLNPESGRMLIGSPLGWTILAAAAALDTVGWLWMAVVMSGVR